jgi:hypothetical protein
MGGDRRAVARHWGGITDVNRALVDRIVAAALYEGYVLYPYRPSVKNRHRWTFGGLYPEAYSTARGGYDAWFNRTECLVRGSEEATVEAVVRFLHLTDRRVGECDPPLAEWPEECEPVLRPVEVLRVGEQLIYPWQEAEEREVSVGAVELGAASAEPRHVAFDLPGRRWREPVCDPGGNLVGVLEREQQPVSGGVGIAAVPLGDGLFRLVVTVSNRSSLQTAGVRRDEALMWAMVSTHAILGVRGGSFVSLMDPPEGWRAAAEACRNVGTYPVLVGEPGETDTMLSSPIILYDHPQVAPESPGDLFDGTEIDEVLTMRILTMTDEEKRQAAGSDERVRAMLARTAGLGPGELLGMHGAIRGLGPESGEAARG